jgi:hypothetical protein
MIHYCAHCDYNSHRRCCVLRHQSRKHKMFKEEVEEGSKIIHYCSHCDYYRANVRRHQRNKHNAVKEEVVEPPLPIQSEKHPTDCDLMEDSIEVFKIYKLLQRMKNK